MNSITDFEELKREILRRLKPLDPEKVILFGSFAYGSPTEHSDIDLYVVTKDDFMPANFREKMEVKLKVARQLRDLQRVIPIDIITHTKKMYEKFVELDSSFAKEIFQKGIRLI